MKKCKYCQSEIDDKAKICPNCKKKQGGKKGLIFLVVVAIIVVAAITAPKSKETSGKIDSSSSTVSASGGLHNVGEYVEKDNVKVSFVGVTTSKGGEYNKPANGNVYVLAEFTIENKTNSEINISSIACFEAYVDDTTTNMSLTSLLEKGNKNQLDGTIAPGKKMNGVIGYEVPAGWKKLEITVTPDFWSSKDIKFIANNK